MDRCEHRGCLRLREAHLRWLPIPVVAWIPMRLRDVAHGMPCPMRIHPRLHAKPLSKTLLTDGCARCSSAWCTSCCSGSAWASQELRCATAPSATGMGCPFRGSRRLMRPGIPGCMGLGRSPALRACSSFCGHRSAHRRGHHRPREHPGCVGAACSVCSLCAP